MKLILVRHGETLSNKKGIYQGITQVPISDKGREQARKVGERLRDEKIAVIYTSDLIRAVETSEIIAEHHPGIKIEQFKELRSNDKGPLVGTPVRNDEIDWNNPPEGVEGNEILMKRAKRIIDMAYDKYPDETVLIVTHHRPVKTFISLIEGKHYSEIDNRSDLENTCVNIFEIEEEGNKIHLLNCSKHLL